ncbi:hypothetical protein PDIG_57600 [Penicillium digitatum PHI26]|uniref:Uncharacterized protein n=2 Tax=Penicillium digitatum TaxID=36651 RepID=K9FLF5_PEND2|nr:hypothetical protein PDIP_67110 [Penicillium digitatum Pd1]EKV08559.1 hypothetical protein PDIP_67110 [Penicillium digitatum Pd1]EKV10069.1 hypothetical protein PDIG_57600 [Penicillium digitatum PHI26]
MLDLCRVFDFTRDCVADAEWDGRKFVILVGLIGTVGMVGFAWWMIALVSVCGCLAANFVYEGSGHETLLPGEKEHI